MTGNILLMPRIGSVQTAILPAMGQILMGTLIDTFGFFQSQQRELSGLRIVGVALVIAGVIMVIIAKAGRSPVKEKTNKTVPHVWLWRIFGLVVDQFGLFRSARRPVGKREIQGIVIMACGAALFHLA